MTFTFGIYPGGLLGDDRGIVTPVRPDDPERIDAALRLLQGDAPRLLVRAYRPYAETVAVDSPPTPRRPERYLGDGRLLDLVLTFREPTGRLGGWLDHVRATVRAEGPRLAAIQICEEPNAALPPLDGSTPNVLEALVRGVVAAKEEARAAGHDIAVGFNAVPALAPDDAFWPALGALAGPEFHRALDYVGLDLIPDVFHPLPAGSLAAAVTAVVTGFRENSLARAGIAPTVPIRICENGWPTGPARPEQRQAEVVEEVVRTLHGLRTRLNLTGYTYFGLRDADSAGASLFHRFGLLRDDYGPKPAFAVYRRLVGELTT